MLSTMKKETTYIIFALALGLFMWPMLTVNNLENPKLVYYFLFGSWFFIIVLLFATSNADEEDE